MTSSDSPEHGHSFTGASVVTQAGDNTSRPYQIYWPSVASGGYTSHSQQPGALRQQNPRTSPRGRVIDSTNGWISGFIDVWGSSIDH